MHSFSTIVIALAAANSVTAAPFKLAAREICGVAPSASGTQAPLATFTDAKTAEQCFADCEANPSCQSFIFGLVDGTVKCELFAVPAAQIPAQESANLVAYDKACASVPDVTPTTANPQGLDTNAAGSEGQNSNGNADQQQQKGQANDQKQPNRRSTCGAAPSGSGSAQPLSTVENIDSLAACIAACKANPSCQSVEFGKLLAAGPDVCRFFSVPAAQVPKATSGQSFQVSDVACA